jgi:hypothetical protein
MSEQQIPGLAGDLLRLGQSDRRVAARGEERLRPVLPENSAATSGASATGRK